LLFNFIADVVLK